MRYPMKNLTVQSGMIDTIVFDFDGTLADTEASSLLTLKLTLLDFGINPPDPTFLKVVASLPVPDMFRKAGISDQVMLSKMVTRYKALYREIAPCKAKLFPGVRETLNHLKESGYELAIATNESRENLDMLLEAFQISHFFGATCCADEVRYPKPWPDMGRKVLGQAGAIATRTLMVGDSVCDIEMAQKNFMHSCAISWGTTACNRLLEISPDWAIMDFTQLLDILDVPVIICTGFSERTNQEKAAVTRINDLFSPLPVTFNRFLTSR